MPVGLPDWNWKEQHVQSGILPAQFVAAQGVLICAGPPSAESEDGDFSVTSIGLVENALINQAKALQRIYEVGSSLPYIIPGQVAVSLQLARIFVHGTSLMGALYEYYMQTDESTGEKNPFIRDTDGNLIDPYSIPHSGTFYANMASDFFNQPFGLLFWIMDSQPKNDLPGQTVSIFYAEHCFASSHQMRTLWGKFEVGRMERTFQKNVRKNHRKSSNTRRKTWIQYLST